jgi:hypothetical protein
MPQIGYFMFFRRKYNKPVKPPAKSQLAECNKRTHRLRSTILKFSAHLSERDRSEYFRESRAFPIQ